MEIKKTYAEKLLDPRWQRMKTRVQTRADFTCELCGSKDKTLHVHHGYYERGFEPWEYGEETLWLLCEDCHTETGDLTRDFHLFISRVHPKDLYNFFSFLNSVSEKFTSRRAKKILKKRMEQRKEVKKLRL